MSILQLYRDSDHPSDDKYTMMTYVDLDRSFLPMSKDRESTEADYRVSLSLGLAGTKKWSDLLELRRVIILAEAGAGKTEELRATAKRLRDDGRNAFFLRLEHLASHFEVSFEIGSYAEFQDWLSTSQQAWLFLDSVDEARLCGPKDFEAAIRVLGDRLGDEKHRAYIYITSRPSEWRGDSDLSLVRRQVPFIEPRQTTVQQPEESPGVPQESATAVAEHAEDCRTEPVKPQVFSLQPFDSDQIREFSRAFGVEDCDAFVEAMERSEADVFARRPSDLLDLLNYWQKHGRLANRAKLVEDNVSSQLTESDPDRAHSLPLSVEDARRGVEMLAAAVTFQRRQRVLIPGQTPDPQLRDESIDAQAVLTDWGFRQIRALLQRPIFDEAIYGAVRFHHRSVREYLTAKWLHRLLVSEKSRRAIEGLFLRERYGSDVVVPSMRPVLAWLILWDDSIREKTRRIAPEVLVEGGDPSELPTNVRKDLLKELCSQYADQEVTDRLFDISELQRFAHADLDETVCGLLETYSDHEMVRELLLRIVWQGRLRSCSEKVIKFALNTANDDHTRIYAIRAIEAVGSEGEKKKLLEDLLADPAFKSETLMAELVSEFAPGTLSVQQVLTLVRRVKKPDEYSHSGLRHALWEFSRSKCPEGDLFEWLQGLTVLLKHTPVIERRTFAVSECYSWLLPSAVFAAERLVRVRHPAALHTTALEIISLARSERTFDIYHMEENAFADLVPKWPELNRKLFWHDVARSRKHLAEKRGRRLTSWHQVSVCGQYWRFSESDFDWCLQNIVAKLHMDDRLVALSQAFEIYVENGRGNTRRRALKKAVSGVPELEDALRHYLKPPAMSDEARAWRRQDAYHRRRQKDYKKKEAANRVEWREWLQAHTDVLRDTSIASGGSLWKPMNYLLQELRRKREDTGKWANGNWEDLIPEFGQEVAAAFRDGCMDYWRRYCPPILSEGKKDKNTTPGAVVVGLAGLAMEAEQIADWQSSLSKEDAAIACRYAVNELNGFPDWLPDLHTTSPDEVKRAILAEIEWEFSQYDGDTPCSYVLDDVAWRADWLKPSISDDVLSLLERYEPKHDDTVRRALDIVLAAHGIDKGVLVQIAKVKLKTTQSRSRQGLWLAAWMCVDGIGALQAFHGLLDNCPNAEHATDLSMRLIVSLLGDRRTHAPSTYHDYRQPPILASLIRLMHTHIRIAEDIDRAGTGAYSPGLRDNAQDARNGLTQLLRDIPGKAAYLALLDLADQHPNEWLREWCRLHAKRRAEADAEGEPWQPRDIARFAEDAEKAPQNHRELFDLTVSRLLDLKMDLEEGDASPAALYARVEEETECRNLIAGWLREHGSGRYSVPQEEELADAKKPDIRIHGMGFYGPVPIELKIADNWSARKLLERLKNQLCDQYLRDVRSNCGVFLLVRRRKDKCWKHPTTNKRLDFDGLLHFLEDERRDIEAEADNIEALRVIGIDLPKRSNRTR